MALGLQMAFIGAREICLLQSTRRDSEPAQHLGRQRLACWRHPLDNRLGACTARGTRCMPLGADSLHVGNRQHFTGTSRVKGLRWRAQAGPAAADLSLCMNMDCFGRSPDRSQPKPPAWQPVRRCSTSSLISDGPASYSIKDKACRKLDAIACRRLTTLAPCLRNGTEHD